MRFSRTASGRLELEILDHPDEDVASAVVGAIVGTFHGVKRRELEDVDGSSWRDFDVMGGCVTVHVSYYFGGTSVVAADEASDGVILDLANSLRANGDKLGIETNRTV
jgi:hypothetical protein